MFPWQLWVQTLGYGDKYIQTKKCINCLIYHKDIRFLVKRQFLEVYALVHYIGVQLTIVIECSSLF